MCGIVAAVSPRNIVPILVEGLKRSSTAATTRAASPSIRTAACGARAAPGASPSSTRTSPPKSVDGGTGIAHTRWATHGAPAVHNAHPHFSTAAPARTATRRHASGASPWSTTASSRTTRSCAPSSRRSGYVFASQTDTEVIAHLVDHHYDGDLFEAVEARRCRGCAAPTRSRCSAATSRSASSARAQGSPLVLGVGRAATRTSSPPTRWRSPASPSGSSTSRKATSSTCSSASTGSRAPTPTASSAASTARSARRTRTPARPSSGPYRHYMQKEIFEQPRAIADTLDARRGRLARAVRRRRHRVFKDVDQVLILACGTSYYAGSVAKYWLEAIAGIPTRSRSRASTATAKRAEPAHAGRDDLAERRDRRHAGRAEARARARHGAHADDLQRRRRARWCASASWSSDARRRRDRRRVDQGVHDPAGRPVPADAGAGAGARPARRRAGSRAPEGAAPPAGRAAGGARARAADHRLGRGVRAARSTRSSSAAACTIRSRSRAR